MTGELPFWAARIREERIERLWSQKGTAARLRDAADEYTRARLPSIENIQRRVRGHESGKNHPGDLYVELYCRAFGLTREALLGPSPAPRAAGEELFPTEHDAAGLMTWITASNTTDEAISHIDEARAALAEAHTQLPPGRVLADVSRLHRQVQALLHAVGGSVRGRHVSCSVSMQTCWRMPASCSMTSSAARPPGHTAPQQFSAPRRPATARHMR